MGGHCPTNKMAEIYKLLIRLELVGEQRAMGLCSAVCLSSQLLAKFDSFLSLSLDTWRCYLWHRNEGGWCLSLHCCGFVLKIIEWTQTIRCLSHLSMRSLFVGNVIQEQY